MRPALLSRVLDDTARAIARTAKPKPVELAISARGVEILSVLNDVFEGLAESKGDEGAVACFRFSGDGPVATT